MKEQSDYSILESELRQSLLRGFSRLRKSQAQGVKLDDAERVLELLGDPQLLTIEHPSYGWKLTIPLIFVSSWELQKGDSLSIAIRQLPEPVLTIYKRRHQEDQSQQKEIHSKLVKALRRYVEDHEKRGGFLLDIHSAHRPDEMDHDEITTENWFGFHDPTKNPHWLFEGTNRQDLPSQVWQVNGLLRLSFPLYPKHPDYPRKMATLILGLSFLSPSAALKFSDDTRARMMTWVRKLADVLTAETLRLHNVLQRREGVERMSLIPPRWSRETERDALHLAVDDLHRQILELAARVGLPRWDRRGQTRNNFLIAFKELNRNYEACLRYRLTIPNLQTIGGGFKNLAAWRTDLKKHLKNSGGDLRDLFNRGRTISSGTAKNGKYGSYYDACRRAIDDLFLDVKTVDEARRKVARTVETTPYRMNRTPGYFVMYLSHPEIIQSWLRDPRVRQFEEYPPELFVWENTALPKRIYYSQIADGTISLGICGVNAELLEHCPAYYELQEIIDESGPRFRYIICEEEFNQLKDELREDLKMVRGARLWASALRRFRRLAYYHFANPWDYHTKLVYDREIKGIRSTRWREHRGTRWQELVGVSDNDIQILSSAGHIPNSWGDVISKDPLNKQGTESFYETDFVKSYLENYLKSEFAETHPSLRQARIHRLKMKGTIEDNEDTSLLVLIPDPQNNEFAKELITRFLTQSELAYSDYEKAIEFSKTYQAEPSQDQTYDVFLCYNSQDRKEVRAIFDQLKQSNLNPWWDQDIPPGRAWVYEVDRQINNIGSVAVFIGTRGISDFQRLETQGIIAKFVKENRTIIPVLLLGASETDVPPLLNPFQRVDFNVDPDPIQRLVKGIKSPRLGDSKPLKRANKGTRRKRQ